VHKPEIICVIVPKICTIPPYHLTDFQFLRNIVTNCIFPHYSVYITNLLTHGAYVMRDVKLKYSELKKDMVRQE